MPIQSFNPYTQQLIETFVADDSTIINQKLDQAFLTYQTWHKTSLTTRVTLFHQLAEVMTSKKQELANLITLEVGVPIKQALGQIDKCVSGITYYSENMQSILAPQVVNISGQKSEVRLAPLGVIFSIMPWNFPFWQVMRVAVPVILSGNVYSVKHASNVPQCSQALANCFLEAGFPIGVFTNFLVSGADSEVIVRDSRVAGVSLTGSTSVGRSVASICGECAKPCVMELGGSDPFIVLSDADLDKAIPVAILSRFRNAGQSCNAAKRFIIQNDIKAEFTKRLVEAVQAMKIGDPSNPETDIGPVVDLKAVAEIDLQVKKSIQLGAELLLGGKTIEGYPAVYMPTILTNVSSEMPVYQEEVFGPVASIIGVASAEEAIEIANDTEYGLGATLWTQDMELANKMIDQLEVGNVFVNTMLTSDPKLPYGGIKNSGFGRELSHYGVIAFMNVKTVVIK